MKDLTVKVNVLIFGNKFSRENCSVLTRQRQKRCTEQQETERSRRRLIDDDDVDARESGMVSGSESKPRSQLKA